MAQVTIRVAYAILPRRVDVQALGRLVRDEGGRLLRVGFVPELGPFALAFGIDAATLHLLASLAPQERGNPN